MQFEEIPTFTKRIKRAGLVEKLEALKLELTVQPDKGAVIPGTAGARKIRMAVDGRGKSGGYRVLYYLRLSHDTILFLDLFAKNEKENLSEREKNDLAKFIRRMK